ncbi:hypothetical protein QWY87_02130 [Lutimonas halocynthiae]|jgi:hypothetical protein|uniref:hypothetical protein n=1 Tax=Lutimonas halocynthiae TaxID=1446477 RepID=UPI0025B491B2|nr:hypothetical protein [Lutimonas halocynthiae]MDN3641483.1 hypothetical protein [Lutimonas halocynthiae]
MKKEILIGFAIGLVATAFGFYIYVEFVSTYSFDETLKILDEGNLYGKVLGLAAIPNLFVFFIFLKKKQDLRARGVLLASFFVAFLILVSKFL